MDSNIRTKYIKNISAELWRESFPLTENRDRILVYVKNNKPEYEKGVRADFAKEDFAFDEMIKEHLTWQ